MTTINRVDVSGDVLEVREATTKAGAPYSVVKIRQFEEWTKNGRTERQEVIVEALAWTAQAKLVAALREGDHVLLVCKLTSRVKESQSGGQWVNLGLTVQGLARLERIGAPPQAAPASPQHRESRAEDAPPDDTNLVPF